jgi:hypothetical protein
MSNQISEITNEEWEDIILRLQAYTRMLVKEKGWFRGIDAGSYISGKEIDDYVFEAIGRFLKNPEKYDPTKRSLVEYLKKHIIRSLVNNDLVSLENQTSSDVFSVESEGEDEDDSSSFLDSILPHTEEFFDQEMDFNEIMDYIESEAKGDKQVEEIFLGLVGYGMKRAEIIEEFGMTSVEYDNAMRRLITIRKKAIKKYDIKK